MSRGYLRLMQTMIALPLADTETGFKLFRRDRILPVLDACEGRGWFWDTEVMVRAYHAGLRIEEIPALFVRRFDKASTVRPIHDTLDYLGKLWRFRAVAARLRRSR